MNTAKRRARCAVWLARLRTLVALSAMAPTLFPASAFGQTRVPSSTAVDRQQTLLDEVASLNENLVEFALDGNTAKIAETAKAIEASLPRLRPALPAATFTAVQSRIRDQQTAVRTGDRIAVALAAVEVYRQLQEAIDPTTRPVPVQIALLDYTGFKILALAKAESASWTSIDVTVKEAAAFWKRVEPRIASAALRNMVSSIMTGLGDGAARKDSAYTAFAATMLLDSVDLLEAQFKSK